MTESGGAIRTHDDVLDRRVRPRRQIAEFITPRRRTGGSRRGAAIDDMSQSSAVDTTQPILEGGGVASVEREISLPVDATPDGNDGMTGGTEDMRQLIEELEFKANPEHIRKIRSYAQDLLKDTKSLFRSEDEREAKQKLKNA